MNIISTSEKILARESIPRLIKLKIYKANALPSELVGPSCFPLLFNSYFGSVVSNQGPTDICYKIA